MSSILTPSAQRDHASPSWNAGPSECDTDCYHFAPPFMAYYHFSPYAATIHESTFGFSSCVWDEVFPLISLITFEGRTEFLPDFEWSLAYFQSTVIVVDMGHHSC